MNSVRREEKFSLPRRRMAAKRMPRFGNISSVILRGQIDSVTLRIL